MKINETLKTLLEERHMTQKELAVKTGLTESSISRYIRSERVPSSQTLINIADALGVSLNEFMQAENKYEKYILDYNQVINSIKELRDHLSKEQRLEIIRILL